MQTQIQCPNCGTPYMAEVHQLIDVGRDPQLKQLLLSGQLNVAVCPNCGAAGQISTPLVYHDPAHELFMIYIPQEMQMEKMQRETLIGRLTRQVMDSTPQEQRRAYMLQPQEVLSMQTFLENVLETEGITKEMIARQRKQAELLNTLATADSDVQDHLIKERSREIDETFFAMLRSYVESASQSNNNAQLIPLLNLQAKLMTETEVGRRLEKRQIAMHALNRDAQKEGGLSSRLLLKHVLLNQEDPETAKTLVQAGIGALDYDFFTGLTAEVDKQQMAGKQDAAQRLSRLRDDLLKMQEDMQRESQAILQRAQQMLNEILEAEDMLTAVQANVNHIDDAFMYVLAAEIAHAEQSGKEDRLRTLESLQGLILDQAESQTPPEIQLLNDLVTAETEAERQQILDENEDLLSNELIEVINLLQEQMQSAGRDELDGRLASIKELIAARL